MSDQPTKLQLGVFRYIERYIRDNGRSPSTRDIQKQFGYKSQTAAMQKLDVLEKKGLIERTPGKRRSIVVVNAELKS